MLCDLRNQEMKHALKISLFVALLLQDFSRDDSADGWILHGKFNFMLADDFAKIQEDFIFDLSCFNVCSISLSNIRVDNLTEHGCIEISCTFFKDFLAVLEDKE